MTPADRLRHLAQDVRRLVPDRRDPERYHEQKSQIEAELRKLARELERRAARQRHTFVQKVDLVARLPLASS